MKKWIISAFLYLITCVGATYEEEMNENKR